MMTEIMTHKGFSARIMQAERLVGDQVFGLPPGSPLGCYPVDAFLKAPDNWMKGPGVFLVPVTPGKGLWFDWTMNDKSNTAVLPTVKGCNPLTGLPTSGYHLERYETKCPKHGVDFLHGRFCPECNYKWPSKNYIAGTCETMWFDGFRAEDGTVRQFFFTEDELRDVASSLIGSENTVPAFGFAFYHPKVLREVPVATYRGSIYEIKNYKTYESYGSSDVKICSLSNTSKSISKGDLKSFRSKSLTKSSDSSSSPESYSVMSGSNTSGFMGLISDSDMDSSHSVFLSAAAPEAVSYSAPGHENSVDMNSFLDVCRERGISQETPVKEVSIGAGAKIDQSVGEDPYPLDSWKDAPDASITLYFVFQEKFEEIKRGGLRDLSGKKEGMLSGMPVG